MKEKLEKLALNVLRQFARDGLCLSRPAAPGRPDVAAAVLDALDESGERTEGRVAEAEALWAALPTYLLAQWQARAPQGPREAPRCVVRGCDNRRDQGRFVGDLCGPCFDFVTQGDGRYSQAYRNAIVAARRLLEEAAQ